MDPLTAVGVAASIVQFISYGIIVAQRLKDYNSAASDVPRSLQHIAAQLPLLLNALERVKTGTAVEGVDLDTRCILKGVVSGCRKQVEKIDAIIDKVVHVPGDSLVTRVQKVFVGLKNDDKVAAIEKNLQTYISVLILHRVIEGSEAASAAFDDTSYFEVPIRKVSPFSERAELKESIEKYLYPAATSQVLKPIALALLGPEAAGKTQLAVDFCHQAYAAGQFRTVFWANATTPETLSRSLEGIADVIRRSKEGFRNRAEKIEFVKSFLSKRWHPWLLVLDNYSAIEFKNLTNLLPDSGSGALLFTTPHHPVTFSGYVIKVPKYRSAEEIESLRLSLTIAVRNNKVSAVKTVLANGGDPNAQDGTGWPCLHRAVYDQNIDVVKILLSNGAKSRAQSPPYSGGGGYVTALYWAAIKGDASITRLLLDHEDVLKLSPNPPGNNAVLGAAAEKGHEEIIRMLVEHGSVHVASAAGGDTTALGLAAKNGHTAVVKLLLGYEAPADAKSEKQAPLTLAARNNHIDTVRILCSLGKADVNAADSSSWDETPALSHVCSNSGYSGTWDEMVKVLLELGADPNRIDSNGTVPLQAAALRGFEGIVSMLLRYGADPYPLNCKGESPIAQAAQSGYDGIVKLLLQAKALDPEVQVKQQEEALIYAAIKGNRDVILLLLQAGVNINTAGYMSQTPLIYAIEKKEIPTARLLIRKGAKSDLADEYGRSPLFLAVEQGYDIIVKEILRHGGKPDIQNSNGETPLGLAATRGHEKVVEVLLELGADRDFANRFGDTPLDLAEEHHHKKIIEILEGPIIVEKAV